MVQRIVQCVAKQLKYNTWHTVLHQISLYNSCNKGTCDLPTLALEQNYKSPIPLTVCCILKENQYGHLTDN